MSKTNLPGSLLVPDFSAQSVTHARQYYYWIGLLPSCPRDYVTVAGLCFSKLNADQVAQDGSPNRKSLVPFPGAITIIDEARIRRLRDMLPRTVIRFYEQGAESGIGENIGDTPNRRRGQLITIPTEKEITWQQQNGKVVRRYDPRPFDEPFAAYAYAVVCEDQENPEPSSRTKYPPTLAEAGLEWPDEIKDLEALLQ